MARRGRHGRGAQGFRAPIHGNPMGPARAPFDAGATLAGTGTTHAQAPSDPGTATKNPRSHSAHKRAAKLHGRRTRHHGGGRMARG